MGSENECRPELESNLTIGGYANRIEDLKNFSKRLAEFYAFQSRGLSLPDEKRLYCTVFGSLASYMAIHQLDDKNVALDGLLGKMHQHFQDIAYHQGLEVDELLIQRVAARSRLFNTGVNFQGEDQEPEESEGVKAYRKASRGE